MIWALWDGSKKLEGGLWGGELRSSLGKWVIWEVQVRKNEVILGMNGVAMDRHGLILWENEATGSRKVFRYLPGLREAIF